MKKTTQCYLEKDGKFLMLYRNRKKNDMNEGKWIAVGGKLEAGETPEEANAREVFEETGIRLNSAVFHGIAEFRNTEYEPEDMYLYSSDDFEIEPGYVPECDEGELAWIPREEIWTLPMWEGDRAFLEPILNGECGLEIRLSYEGDRLIGVERNS
ncbi:MAG: 8-oxo-dGTP diphosphatase [Mogibacterium sp.]|nr:8-oxo-dGTP diphosphatase [Mogibacterium sp.]